jgi:hypothetical protein
VCPVVIPKFADMFAQMGLVELPLLTRALFGLGEIAVYGRPVMVPGALWAGYGSIRAWRRQSSLWTAGDLAALAGILAILVFSFLTLLGVVVPIVSLQAKLTGR